MRWLALVLILGLQAPPAFAGGKLDLRLAQYRRNLPPPDYEDDGRSRRRRYYEQEDYEYGYEDDRPRRISKDTLVGIGAMVFPGGGFLLWMDPELDHKYINTGSGLFLGLITAAVGIKFYVSGDFGPALAVHGGGIAGGLLGHHIASRPPSNRRAGKPASTPVMWEAKFRF
jgi:hypothetical protein